MAASSKKNMRKKGKGKTSNVKIANKNQAKLKKKAKMKEKTKQLRKQAKEQVPEVESQPESEVECEDTLDAEDLQYYQDNLSNISFLKNEKGINKKAKKRKWQEGDESSYEKAPRNSFAGDEKVYKRLLPVKMKNKIIPQSREIIPKSEEEDKSDSESQNEEVDDEEFAFNHQDDDFTNLSAAEQMLVKEEHLTKAKQKMALFALSIIENPNEHISRLRELLLMLQNPTSSDVDVAINKLGMITLMEIFKDIVPGYKIRKLTEKEQQQKMSKEFKVLHSFEESLLKSYKHYLEYLWSVVSQPKDDSTLSQTKLNDKKVMKEVATQCLCKLLVSCYHFNFRSELISFVVPCMNLFNKVSSNAACEAVKEVFKIDKLGAASLEIVKGIEDLVKKKISLVKPKVLSTLLSLKIKEIDIAQAKSKAEKEKHKQKLLKMSRRERKREKQMERLQNELLETKASEDKKKKLEYNTRVIQHVFATYVRILKKSPDSALVTVVLEGLTKFAHFVNIDYFEDLFSTLKSMIASQSLTLQQTIQCTLTAFMILSGQGNVLNIDPVHFYKYFYHRIISLNAGESSEYMLLLLNTLEETIFKRKRQITKHRVLAFMKRLSTIALQTLPEASIALLGVVRSLIHSFPYTDVMFENEQSGSGQFMPEVNDPEYSHAHNSSLWELAILQKHVCPDVVKFTNYVAHQAPLSGKGQLPAHLSKLSAVDLYEKYHEETITKFANSKLNK
ncbi:complex 3 homolog [Octopus vulgaris]|uniref:NOC3-like protein n=1 Tax=Octopus vulgaris TaxID=6645 RepID=A0AA36FGF4_OCTVU|nr:complex 3 homolog [Octopus vulgaris]